MTPVVLIALAAAGIALLLVMHQRERAMQNRLRLRFFSDCKHLFDDVIETVAEDGYPRLEGRMAGRRVQLGFIPDNMTIRRLPQLWLSVTLLTPMPIQGALGIQARANDNDFFALTPELPQRLDRPALLPPATQVRTTGTGGQAVLDKAATAIANMFLDPRVKEVVVTGKGLRVVWQASEGRRGEHLILRQCSFPLQTIDPSALVQLFDGLDAVALTLAPPPPSPPPPHGRDPRRSHAGKG